MSEWQPIETAPKDGTKVLLHSPGKCEKCPQPWDGSFAGRWIGGAWLMGMLDDGERCHPVRAAHEPAHWQPMPEPPE